MHFYGNNITLGVTEWGEFRHLPVFSYSFKSTLKLYTPPVFIVRINAFTASCLNSLLIVWRFEFSFITTACRMGVLSIWVVSIEASYNLHNFLPQIKCSVLWLRHFSSPNGFAVRGRQGMLNEIKMCVAFTSDSVSRWCVCSSTRCSCIWSSSNAKVHSLMSTEVNAHFTTPTMQ